jgi:hypothetical protein
VWVAWVLSGVGENGGGGVQWRGQIPFAVRMVLDEKLPSTESRILSAMAGNSR